MGIAETKIVKSGVLQQPAKGANSLLKKPQLAIGIACALQENVGPIAESAVFQRPPNRDGHVDPHRKMYPSNGP
ncbi:MAG: hypothetical protein KDB14_11050 [Planctomycetales bacterium]|nr:hypothetical protein [Planctomycetales bacterium]